MLWWQADILALYRVYPAASGAVGTWRDASFVVRLLRSSKVGSLVEDS